MSTAGSTETAPSLAGRLQAARAAEAAPRQRAAEIETALRAAIERHDWAEAGRIEGELRPAKEAAAFAAAVTSALAEQLAFVDAEVTARDAGRLEAQQRAAAETALAGALDAEKRGLAQADAALSVMRGHLEAAQREYRAALDAEGATWQARSSVIAARRQLGEFPPGHPGPAAIRPNQASSLTGSSPLVRALRDWRP